MNATAGRVLILHRVVRQRLHNLLRLIGRADGLLRALVKIKVFLVNDYIHVWLLAEFAKLQRRKLHLRRAAPTKHMHVRHRILSQALVHVLRDLGGQHVIRVFREDARHIQRHITCANDRNLLGLQRPFTRVIRMRVIPVHKIRRAIHLG